jgi:hypothetical protein
MADSVNTVHLAHLSMAPEYPTHADAYNARINTNSGNVGTNALNAVMVEK